MLRWKQRGHSLLPLQATSVQTSDASIYVVGGYLGTNSEMNVLSDCL